MHKLLKSPRKITAQRKHGRSSINVQNIHNAKYKFKCRKENLVRIVFRSKMIFTPF